MGTCSTGENAVQGVALIAVFLVVKTFIIMPLESSVYNYRKHIAIVCLCMVILAGTASWCYSSEFVSFTIASAIGFLTSDASYLGDPVPPAATTRAHQTAIAVPLLLSACACVLVDILSTRVANWTQPVAVAFGSLLNVTSMHVLAGARYHSGTAYGFQYLRFQAWETLAISYVVSARAKHESGLAVVILLPIMYVVSGMIVWHWYFTRQRKPLIGKKRDGKHRWAQGVSSGVTIYFIIGGLFDSGVPVFKENGTEVPDKPTWAILGLPIAAAAAAALQIITEDLPHSQSASVDTTIVPPTMKFKAYVPSPAIQF